MKLYFYFLDRGNNGITVEECEVEEKKKTYCIVGKPPYNYLHKTVNKMEIGRLSGAFQNYIVLTEKNAERAADALTCVCRDDIRRAENAIRVKEEEIEKLKKTIENIEKWRSENAGQ